MKKKQTHRYREQINGHQWGEGSGERQYRGRGLRGTSYYITYKISYKNMLYNMENIANIL